MKKKLFSAILAIAMIASLAVPAFATSSGSGGAVDKPMDYTTSTKTPVVTVTMPATPTIVLNPYGMSVTVGTAANKTDQIVNPTYFITNKTQAPLKVGVKATATKEGDTILVTRPCTGKELTKNAFLMVEFAQTASNTTEPTSWIANLDKPETINERCYPQIIPIEGDGKSAPALMTVDKTDGSTANYIAVKVLGNLAGAPTGGWTEADKAGIKLVFTFTPSVANAIDVSGATGVTANYANGAVMGTVVRLTETGDDKLPVVKDANDVPIVVTKVQDKLYYFVMPATKVTVTLSA